MKKGFLVGLILFGASEVFAQTTFFDIKKSLPIALAMVLGIFSPFIIQYIKKLFKQKWQRWLISIGVCTGIGLTSCWISGVYLTLGNVLAWIGVIYGWSLFGHSLHKNFLKKKIENSPADVSGRDSKEETPHAERRRG